jgi:hypothetical protein
MPRRTRRTRRTGQGRVPVNGADPSRQRKAPSSKRTGADPAVPVRRPVDDGHGLEPYYLYSPDSWQAFADLILAFFIVLVMPLAWSLPALSCSLELLLNTATDGKTSPHQQKSLSYDRSRNTSKTINVNQPLFLASPQPSPT